MKFGRKLAIGLVTGALKVRVGRFEGLPLFIALLVPLYDLLRRGGTNLFVLRTWYPRDLPCPPPCCDGLPPTNPPEEGYAVPLRPSASTSEWCDRVGVASVRLGGPGEDEGLDLAPRKSRKTTVAEYSCLTKATKIVRENVCTDFIRTYVFVMVCRQRWIFEGMSAEAAAEMMDNDPRVSFVHDLALEIKKDLDKIQNALEAHYAAMHGPGLLLDGTPVVRLTDDSSGHFRAKRKRQDNRVALLEVQNQAAAVPGNPLVFT